MYENGTLRGLLEPSHKVWVSSMAFEEGYEEGEDVPANIIPAPSSNTSHSQEVRYSSDTVRYLKNKLCYYNS
jgi:hypothetical protein